MAARTILAAAVAVAAGCHVPHPAPAPVPVAATAPVTDACRDATLEQRLVELSKLADNADFEHHGMSLPEQVVPPPELPGTYDAGVRVAWTALLDAIEKWGSQLVDHPSPGELAELAGALDEALARAGLRYYVRLETPWYQPEPPELIVDGSYGLDVIPFRIVAETSLEAAGRTVDALDLRMLVPGDPGAFGEFDGRPLVFLDPIDDMTAELVPVLADGAGYPVGYDLWTDTEVGRALAAAAGAAIRGDLRGVVGRDPGADRAKTAAAINAAFAEEVRFHEAQHAFDARRSRRLPTPPALRRALAAIYVEHGETNATAQLSAYLAEVAGDHRMTRVALWSLVRQAFSRESGETAAAIVAIEQLARALGTTEADAPPAIVDGAFRRDRLAVIARTLAPRLPNELRAAAAASWGTLYGEPYLPIISRGSKVPGRAPGRGILRPCGEPSLSWLWASPRAGVPG